MDTYLDKEAKNGVTGELTTQCSSSFHSCMSQWYIYLFIVNFPEIRRVTQKAHGLYIVNNQESWGNHTKYKLCIYVRLVPIMLLKLPIMLWSNAPEFCLLCSYYAPYVSRSPQIQHFLFLILLKITKSWVAISSLYLFFPSPVQFHLSNV